MYSSMVFAIAIVYTQPTPFLLKALTCCLQTFKFETDRGARHFPSDVPASGDRYGNGRARNRVAPRPPYRRKSDPAVAVFGEPGDR